MKKFLSLIIISSILVLLIFFSKLFFENNLFNIQDKIYKKYPNLQTSFRKHLFKKDSVIENLNNDYNYKFLPETQFINLNVSSKKFLFSESFEITQAEKKILGGYKNRFNYTNNIKPAPDPFHTLEKYYGNLTIQEYRQLLNNNHILLVIDKPLTKILPELHEENYEPIPNYMSIHNKNNVKPKVLSLKRKKQQKKKKNINKV